MNGIENIIAAIQTDAEQVRAQIMGEAERQAAEITKRYHNAAAERVAQVEAKGVEEAALAHERILSNAELESRKHLLKIKQNLINDAFQQAVTRINHYDTPQIIDLLSRLVVKAALNGREELIFAAHYREEIGPQVVQAANRALTVQGHHDAQLTLAEETREIGLGVVLKSGQIEISCIPEKLIWAQRDRLALEIADILFQEG